MNEAIQPTGYSIRVNHLYVGNGSSYGAFNCALWEVIITNADTMERMEKSKEQRSIQSAERGENCFEGRRPFNSKWRAYGKENDSECCNIPLRTMASTG